MRPRNEPSVQIEILHAAREPDLAAELLELPAEGAHDQRQAIRSQVGTVLVDDRRLAVAIGQDLEDSRHVGTGVPRGQLAVAERTGASLAEEVVAFRIERSPGVEPTNVGDAILDGPAALQDQRAIALLGQHVAGDQAGGPGADDHRPVFQGTGAGLGPVEPFGDEGLDIGIRAGLNPTGLFLGKVHFHRVHEVKVVVASGVQALAEDSPADDIASGCRPRRLAARTGRISSGSSSSSRRLLILTDMVEVRDRWDRFEDQA